MVSKETWLTVKRVFFGSLRGNLSKCTGIHHMKVPLSFVIRNPPLCLGPCTCCLRNFKTLKNYRNKLLNLYVKVNCPVNHKKTPTDLQKTALCLQPPYHQNQTLNVENTNENFACHAIFNCFLSKTPGIHGKNPDKAVVSLNRSTLFMCLANYIHLCLFQWKPIDINFCLSIRCDSPSLGHKETDGSNSFWMWRPSDFMMSRLKAVLSHLVFKLHRPVVRRSTCLRSVSVSAQETWTKHHTSTWDKQLRVPQELDLMGTLCPSLALSASSPSPCHSPLIYSRGVVPNEWFVRVRSGWFTPGCDQRVLSPRRPPLTAWDWDQTSSSSFFSSICSGSHKLGASFDSCCAPSATHLHFSATAVAPPSAWLEKNLTPSGSEKTDLQGFFLLLFFYSTALHSGR